MCDELKSYKIGQWASEIKKAGLLICAGEGVGGQTNRWAGAAVCLCQYTHASCWGLGEGALQMLERVWENRRLLARVCLTLSFAKRLSCVRDSQSGEMR